MILKPLYLFIEEHKSKEIIQNPEYLKTETNYKKETDGFQEKPKQLNEKNDPLDNKIYIKNRYNSDQCLDNLISEKNIEFLIKIFWIKPKE